MSLNPTAFKTTSVKHLFATPLVISELPDEVVSALNPVIKNMVLERSQTHKGVFISNQGGWQSDDKLAEWGDEPIDVILTCLRQPVGNYLNAKRLSIGWVFAHPPVQAKLNGPFQFLRRHIY